MLVVDDEPAIVEVLEILLEESGFDVVVSATAEEARKHLASGTFDLYILDKNLPDASGIDLAAETIERGNDGRVVIITGYPSVESAVRAVELDIAQYLTKPFDLADVERKVRAVVESLALSRENTRLMEELQRKNALLEGLVARDPLTQLYNHRYFQESLEREVRRAVGADRKLSLILLDIDNFETLNEQLGHTMGDQLLTHVAGTLRNQDGPGESIAARFGSDEFALLLLDTDKHRAAEFAEDLRLAVHENGHTDEVGRDWTVSLGVASCPTDATTRTALVEAAEVALFAAKHGGANRMISFGPALARSGVRKQKAAEAEVRRFLALEESLESRAFDFAYQPIVDAERQVKAYEALVRPRDKMSFPNPIVLFETAARAGRIRDLGGVLRNLAISPSARLSSDLQLFVNAHPRELNEDLVKWAHSVPTELAKRLVIEITEAAAIESFDLVSALMAEIRTHGVRFALDDVGAGYMGLGALTKLAPAFIKLDLSLLRGITLKSREARLVKHLVDFAQDEEIAVIAEGIESPQELDVVQTLGCSWFQGYLFAKPGEAFVQVDPS